MSKKNNQQTDSQSFEQLKKDFDHPPLIVSDIIETEKKPEISAFLTIYNTAMGMSQNDSLSIGMIH